MGKLFDKLSIEDFPKPLSYPSQVSTPLPLDNRATAQPTGFQVIPGIPVPDRGSCTVARKSGRQGGSPTGLEPVCFVTEMQWNQEVTDRVGVEKPPHARPTRHMWTAAVRRSLEQVTLNAVCT